MQNLNIASTKYTPSIKLNAETGIIALMGKSYPENTFSFYKPLMQWLENYFNGNAKNKTVFNFEIIYFNSSTSKLFFDLFDLIDDVNKSYKIEINWIYDEENETAEEAGEDFKEDFEDLNFNLIKK